MSASPLKFNYCKQHLFNVPPILDERYRSQCVNVDLHKLSGFLNRIFWAVVKLIKTIKVLASKVVIKLQNTSLFARK